MEGRKETGSPGLASSPVLWEQVARAIDGQKSRSLSPHLVGPYVPSCAGCQVPALHALGTPGLYWERQKERVQK